MTTYYIIPPRKLVSGGAGSNVVTSLNSLKGDLTLLATDGVVLNVVGSTFTLTGEPNKWVQRIGDTMTGNLQFTPSGGAYGLRLYSSTLDPTQTAIGAVYFNTDDNTIKIYNLGVWQTLAQTGALTETVADGLYLRLDGTNDNLISGDIDFQSVLVRLGRKASDPGTGATGDVFFRTSDNVVRVYNGSAWITLSGTVTSVGGINGVKTDQGGGAAITSSGNLQLDLTYSPTWTGVHTYSQAIVFAAGQTFDIPKLTIGSQANGDMIYYSTGWTRLAIGTNGKVLKVVGGFPVWSDAVAGQIGTPTDTLYSDGFFDTWTASTQVSDAFDDVNELLKDIVPAQAGLLTGAVLTNTSLPTVYTVKVSDGIPSGWYANGVVAGSTISTYFLNGNYTLSSPSISDTFRCGKKSDATTFGTVYHKRYTASTNADLNSWDLTSSSVGTSGTLTTSNLATYNQIWKKVNAALTHTQTADGYEGHVLRHVSIPSVYSAGESNRTEFWKDTHSDANPLAVFGTAPVAVAVTPVDKHLSGIAYYGLNSTFDVTFAAATGIFNKCYHASQVARISQQGMANVNLNPVGIPAYTDTFDKTGGNKVTVTLDSANQTTMSKFLTVTLYKAHGATTAANASISRAICTYDTASTTTSDIFVDEAQRVVIGTTTSWNSTTILSNGNAQVRNGTLQYPDSSDYPGFTGDQEYQRFFYKTSASTGSLTFNSGFNISNISAYGTGDLNVLLYLDDDALWFDLGQSVGLGGDGSTRADAIGARNIGSSGTLVNWSIGKYTTGVSGFGNEGRYRIVVIFLNADQTITSITSS